MRVRIEQVAQAAGCSIKTVSRVLNCEPNVRPETRERVDAAIRKLKYRPHSSARSLASSRSFLVAMLYDNPSNNYLMEIVSGVLETCEANQYGLVLRPLTVGQRNIIDLIENLLAQYQPDGLILTPPVTDEKAVLDALSRHQITYASISAKAGNCELGVSVDEHQAVIDMIGHITSLGHRRIAHVKGHPAHGASEWRLAGYRDGLQRAGISFDPALVVDGEFSFESGVTAALHLLALPERPTAVFAANDDSAAGVIHVALEQNLRVPRDLSVFGFDDSPVSRQIWPSLTTVRQPLREMGRMATAQLLHDLRNEANVGSVVRMPYQLQLRQSTGPVPTLASSDESR
jgi:LacI family transcriptional regulator